MNIYRYEFEYKVYNSDGLEIDKGIETSKGYDQFHAENSLRIRLEEGAESDEDFFSVKLIPTFVMYIDTNRLIAEFMGLKEHEGSYYLQLYNGGDWVPDVELDYHTSWDWLMPVVIKIGDNANILGAMKKLRTYSKVRNLEDTYQSVVEFIKNQNN